MCRNIKSNKNELSCFFVIHRDNGNSYYYHYQFVYGEDCSVMPEIQVYQSWHSWGDADVMKL